MTTANQPGSDLKQRFVEAMLAAYFAIAPSRAPLWRLAVAPPPAAMLVVGEPVPRIGP
ncbi:MAG: hypothetical protein HKO63_01745 [Acidimicrobiia bacterium]|nr:hypothetical protein [Acidimicrobiia bacterium]MBT8192810.1 hypothetical protein [Acidimicrobiia bacterium]NNJ46808.1 hypothetical protein [Acidimicrobiia bacterium]NNL96904.1 hypothetical protein [Acidimicrobiia bacterium]